MIEAARMARLGRIAAAVSRCGPRRNPDWPALWLFTDPYRLPDVLAAAAALPRGSGVVLRTFGKPELAALAPALGRLSRRRDLTFLVGADESLAVACDADGLHLPERLAAHLPRLRARHPRWRFTLAAHSPRALRRAATLGADAAFLSPVFASLSPSAGSPLGPTRVSMLTRGVRLAVYGLGGINEATAPRLVRSGLAGFAGVGFEEPFRT